MIVEPVRQYVHSLRDKVIDHMWHFLLSVLKAGPIPQHVAFIMDGNRRYARAKAVKVKQGHVEGYIALRRVCLTCPFLINTKLC
jgi:ditrans,polycis-polyprenyl diphosphate synthase